MTKMLNNIEESLFNAIQALLTANNYSNVKLLNSFPNIEDKAFELPSVSVELLTVPPKESADLGQADMKSVAMIISIFAEDDFQRGDLSDIIVEYLEDNSLDIKDYLTDSDDHVTYGRFVDITSKVLRGELEKEKFRIQIDFDIEYLEDI